MQALAHLPVSLACNSQLAAPKKLPVKLFMQLNSSLQMPAVPTGLLCGRLAGLCAKQNVL
jgi:hypothetical protein